jgi:hypothetical protein
MQSYIRKVLSFRIAIIAVIAALLLALPSSRALAQNIGDACTVAGQLIRERAISPNAGIVCNGSTYDAFQSYAMSPLRHGINTPAPEATLDINGELRIGSTGIACSATNAGAARYSGGYIQWCNGTAWANVGGGGGTPAGVDRQIQFNSGSAFGAHANLAFTASGQLTLEALVGAENVFIGLSAGSTGVTGANNVFVGRNAGRITTSGTDNVFLGRRAGYSNQGGGQNVFIGERSGNSNSSGSDNVFLGKFAGFTNATGNKSIAIGRGALYNFAPSSNDAYNVAVGHLALTGAGGSNGIHNTALGGLAGDSITTGSDNIFIGYDADTPTATTSNHLNIGNTIYSNLSTDWVGIGILNPAEALDVSGGIKLTSSIKFGSIAGAAPASGLSPAGSDKQIQFNSGGSFGASSGLIWDRATSRLGVGAASPAATLDVSGTVNLNVASATSDRESLCIASGGGAVTRDTAGNNCDTSSARFKHHIAPLDLDGLALVSAFNPSSFIYNSDKDNVVKWGFIAEEMAAINPHFAAYDEAGLPYSINKYAIMAVMAEAIKELKAENDSLRATNDNILTRIEALERNQHQQMREQ